MSADLTSRRWDRAVFRRWRLVALRVAVALAAGCLVGVLDLWIFDLSLRGFLAGLAAGTTYFLVLGVTFGADVPFGLLFVLAPLGGAAGGVAWWAVSRAAPLWAAVAVGLALALAHVAAGALDRRAGR